MFRIIFFKLPLILLCTVANAEVIKCSSQQGRILFTDNRTLCDEKKAVSTQEYAEAEIKSTNNVRYDYRTPKRYYRKANKDHNIYLETGLWENDRNLAEKALKKLEENLSAIFSVLPKMSAAELKNVKFYLMWGGESPLGGRVSGMSYIRQGEPKHYRHLDPRWNHAVIVYSAKNFVYLDKLWTRKALMHELAHAWHITNWPEKHPPIYNAYLNAKAGNLYIDVEDYKGRVIPKAYAIKNQLEYFAELSAIYFVGGNYFPYAIETLKAYDPAGFSMLQSIWY